MIDILEDFRKRLTSGERFALATVIRTWRSAPRSEGAAMIVSPHGIMTGSVSGGCVEASVVKAAMEVLDSAQPRRLSFGVTDEDAWSVGLSCGGEIDIWLEAVNESKVWNAWMEKVRSNQGCLLITGLEGKKGHALYSLEDNFGEISPELLASCELAYSQHKTQIVDDYFLNVFPAKSRLIIIGAAHVSLDLIRLAHLYNFETMVIDPRGIFADKERFDIQPDRLFQDWPAEVLPDLKLDTDTFVVVLTHDPKIDDQALQIALTSDVAYIGALGSKKTHSKRVARLQQVGLSDAQINRIHGPVGVNINARQPAEIALSIMAQIIQVKNQYL